MGRTHSEEFSHLPKGMYFNKKGQTYYLRRPGCKDVRLGKTLHQALKLYWEQPNIFYEARTMADIITRYMQEVSPSKAASTHKTNLQAAKKLLLAFADIKPSEVEARHIYQYLEARKDAPTRANREVALLGSIFNEAIRWGVVQDTPVKGIKRNREAPRTRLVTDQELNNFKKFAPDWMRLYIDLKLSIALRQTDMLTLSTDNWDEATGLWVETSKTGKRICFTATGELKELIHKILKLSRSNSSGNITQLRTWFFPSATGRPLSPDGLRTAWNRAMRKALESGDLKERFQERDLRARAATDCESILEAFELCGHSSISTTRRIYRRGFTKVKPLKKSSSC